MSEHIEDPGATVIFGKDTQPIVILPETPEGEFLANKANPVFLKIGSVEDIDPQDVTNEDAQDMLAVLAESDLEGPITIFEVNAPAGDSIVFLKYQATEDNVDELISLSREGLFDGIDGSALFPGFVGENGSGEEFGKIPGRLKWGEIAEDQPDQSAWTPVDDLGFDVIG